MGELLRLLDQAKRSGVLDQLLQSMVVPETSSGSMSDATKRRKEQVVGPIESHSELPRMILQWMVKLGM